MHDNPKSTAKIAGHPIHPMLIVFPIAFWVGGFLCDIAYWRTANADWAFGAMWLVGAGLAGAALAAVAGLTDFLGDRRIRNLRESWQHMIGNVIAVLIAAYSLWLRYSMGAEAAVLPWGLFLSALVVLMLLYTGWKGGEMVYRHKVAVDPLPGEAVDRDHSHLGTGRPLHT